MFSQFLSCSVAAHMSEKDLLWQQPACWSLPPPTDSKSITHRKTACALKNKNKISQGRILLLLFRWRQEKQEDEVWRERFCSKSLHRKNLSLLFYGNTSFNHPISHHWALTLILYPFHSQLYILYCTWNLHHWKQSTLLTLFFLFRGTWYRCFWYSLPQWPCS